MSPPGWIFGYGSLVWRPAFPHVARRPARVDGWRRVFWQGSTDHRGVPGAPGRVVTLVPDARAHVWGMAYEIAAPEADAILAVLDHREKGGYARHRVRVDFQDDAEGIEALVYVATSTNPNYLGEAPLDAIARQVRAARGPSGANVEYVVRLAEALRAIPAEDEHVFALERLVRGRSREGLTRAS